jgi:alpha-tubulin suppressor-like RCC1 family protein
MIFNFLELDLFICSPSDLNPSYPTASGYVLFALGAHFFSQTAVASGVVMAEAGLSHACLLDITQAVKCSGYDDYGKQGDGAGISYSTSFTTVPGLSGVSSIAVGTKHTCVLLLDSAVLCWGVQANGRLGDGTDSFGGVTEPSPATELSAGNANVLLVAFNSNTYVLINSLISLRIRA